MLDQRITSRRHPLVGRLRDAARRDSDEVLLDGPHLLDEALRSLVHRDAGRVAVSDVVVTHAAIARPEIERLCDAAAAEDIPVHLVPDALTSAISPTSTPAGVVALARISPAELDEVVTSQALVVVVTGVQDPGNVGSLVRSAEAAGATGVITTGGTADPLGWKALRGSMGSGLRLPLHRAPDIDTVLIALRGRGVTILAADAGPAPATPLPDLRAPLALIVGAEGQGLTETVRQAADAAVRIPLAPTVESLNVAVAGALLLFEIRRRRGGDAVIP